MENDNSHSNSSANVKQIIEACLFMSPKPLSFEDLFKLCEVNVLEFRKALNELMNELDERNSAMEVVESASGFQMRVRTELLDKVGFFAASPELSPSITKTLAFIAYKQPVKQSLVVRYRSNVAYDDIKILLEQGFISREPFEKTFILRTTKKFVDYFGEKPVKLVKHEKPAEPSQNQGKILEKEQVLAELTQDFEF
ncbi:MAG: SMC-Scp complex subunit ScpB [Candidatus Diapherotrites archaeon]|nr:SMC-Scp complex subunit ScpB [Candidatus Diapherotrites archaeon]